MGDDSAVTHFIEGRHICNELVAVRGSALCGCACAPPLGRARVWAGERGRVWAIWLHQGTVAAASAASSLAPPRCPYTRSAAATDRMI